MAQYREGTAKYEEVMASGEAALSSELRSNEYIAAYLDPELGQIETKFYVYESLDSSAYAMGLIVDPCKGQSYDCCHRRYGTPQYAVDAAGDGSYRVVSKSVFLSATEPVSTGTLVDEFGEDVSDDNSRFADDEVYID
ncbi:unnamed protein product, partial [Phaeothamnion confervicola]